MVLKNVFVAVSTLAGCGGLEGTDFEQFYFGSVWWSSKKWFLTVSSFGRVWWS